MYAYLEQQGLRSISFARLSLNSLIRFYLTHAHPSNRFINKVRTFSSLCLHHLSMCGGCPLSSSSYSLCFLLLACLLNDSYSINVCILIAPSLSHCLPFLSLCFSPLKRRQLLNNIYIICPSCSHCLHVSPYRFTTTNPHSSINTHTHIYIHT